MPTRRPLNMPPVGLLSELAPVDHPQFIPSSPMRLPPPGDRLGKRVTDNLMGAPIVGDGAPAGAVQTSTFEAHRYASVIQGTYNAQTTADPNPFITESNSKRNYLMFRNTAAAGGANIYISFGTPAATNVPLVLTPGQLILFDTVVPQDDIYALADTGVATLAYGYSTFVPS